MKKILKVISFAIFAFIPFIILWMSLTQYRKQIRDEKISELEIQISRIIQNNNKIFSPFFPPIREIGVFKSTLEAVDSYEDQRKSGNMEKRLISFLKSFSQNYNESEICLQTERNNKCDMHFFKNGKIATSSRFIEITNKLYKYSDPRISKPIREQLRHEIYQHLKQKYNCFFDMGPLKAGDSSKISYYHLRSPEQPLKTYIIAKHSQYYTFFIELRYPGSSEKISVKKIVKNFNNNNFGILFIPNKKETQTVHKDQKVIASSYIKKIPLKTLRIIKAVKQNPERFVTSNVDDFLFSAVPFSPQREYRIAVVTKLPDFEKRMDLQLLIAMAGIFATFLVKIYAEHLISGRSIKLSLGSFLFFIFLSINILPLVGAINLSNEYIVSRFQLEKNKSGEELNEDLVNLDLKNFENIEKLITTFRKYNSTEKIANFVGLSPDKSIKELSLAFLNKVLKTFNHPPVHQVWGYELNKDFFCWQSLDSNYHKAEINNPLFQEAFKPRFAEFLSRTKTKVRNDNEKIKFNSLKEELFDKLYLNLSGQKAYFKLKENIGSVIKVDTFFDQNFLVSIPISRNGANKYILTYLLNSKHLRNPFPHDKLSLKKDKPTIALFGTADYFKAEPGDINRISADFPELAALAKKSHLAKAKIAATSSNASESYILLALPLRSCEYVLAGKRFTKSLGSIQKELKQQTDFWIGILLLTLVVISFVTTYYFALPIRQLTFATKQIISDNYGVRLDESHSDEFGEISKVFNKMARGLEEGRLLSTYVSDSVENMVLQNPDQSSQATVKMVTVVFSSILSFKNLLTKLPTDELFSILQTHLSETEKLSKTFHGEIDKMIEDKVMIVFEDYPNQKLSSAERALKLALELKQNFARLTNHDLAIGINTGKVVSAVMGAEDVRLSETIVGDPVNLAARLAALAQNCDGSKIVVSGQTKSELKVQQSFAKLDVNKVKGKTQEIEAFIYKA